MAEQLPSFLKRKDQSILFNRTGEFIFYVPEYFFTSKVAVVIGEYVELLGILNYSLQDEKGNRTAAKPFKFPSSFMTKPSSIVPVKGLKLMNDIEVDDYRELHYKMNDQVIVSSAVVQDIGNLEKFVNLFVNGHVPTSVPYDKMHEYFTECIHINGSSFGVCLQLIGILISESCRDPRDYTKPFRLANNKNMNAYHQLALNVVPKYVSPSASITSENWNASIVGAMLSDKEIDSPIEKMLMQ